jgi:putative hemolysin
MKEATLWVVVMAIFVAATIGIIVAANQDAAACAAKGGHLHTQTGYGLTANGKYGTTYTTMCLSSDGRILE